MKPTSTRPRPRAPMKLQASATGARRLPARASSEDPHYEDDFEPSMKLSRAFVIVLIMHIVAVGGIFAFNAIKTRQLTDARTADSNAAALAPKVMEPELIAPKAPPTPMISATRRHVVKAGDTPYKLAQNYGVKIEDLLAVNYMKENSMIVVGQELKIPDGGTPVPPQPSATKQPAVSRASVTAAATPSVPPKRATSTPSVDSDVQSLLGVTDAPKPPTRSPGKNPVNGATPQTYTVEKGDNPYNIAMKLGVDYGDLLRVNNIDDPKKLQIGQQLKVPTKN